MKIKAVLKSILITYLFSSIGSCGGIHNDDLLHENTNTGTIRVKTEEGASLATRKTEAPALSHQQRRRHVLFGGRKLPGAHGGSAGDPWLVEWISIEVGDWILHLQKLL